MRTRNQPSDASDVNSTSPDTTRPLRPPQFTRSNESSPPTLAPIMVSAYKQFAHARK